MAEYAGITADVPTRRQTDTCMNVADLRAAFFVFLIGNAGEESAPMIKLLVTGMIHCRVRGEEGEGLRACADMIVELPQRAGRISLDHSFDRSKGPIFVFCETE